MTLSEIEAREKKIAKNVKICISPRKTLQKADFSEVTRRESLQKLQNIVLCHQLKTFGLLCSFKVECLVVNIGPNLFKSKLI